MIAGDPAARTKWVLTKPVTAEVSAELKEKLCLNHSSTGHHESGASMIARDVMYVEMVKASMQCNPFSLDSKFLISIMTGRHADPLVLGLETLASMLLKHLLVT